MTKRTDLQFVTEVAYTDGGYLTGRAGLYEFQRPELVWLRRQSRRWVRSRGPRGRHFGAIIDRLLHRAPEWPHSDPPRS